MRIALAAAACMSLGAAAWCNAASLDANTFRGVWLAKSRVSRLLPMNGESLPFTPEGAAAYRKNVADLKSDPRLDKADYACVPQGMPRAMTSAYPFQIIVTPKELVFAHQQNREYRQIEVSDQHQDTKIWDPSYMGDGIAHMDGNDLVIDSTNFKAEAIFLDATGLPASDKLHVVERLSLTASGDLQDLITIEDPGVFTKPWTTRLVFARRDDLKVPMDWICSDPHPLPSARATQRVPAEPPPLTAAQQALSGYWHSLAPSPGTGRPSGSGGKPAAAAAAPGGAAEAAPSPAQIAASMGLKFTPAAVAYRAAEERAANEGTPTTDPSSLCLPSAMPGNLAGGAYNIGLFVEPRHMVILYEDGRGMLSTYLDQPHSAHPGSSWAGESVGHWEGDTLVTDTIGFNDKNLIPMARVPTSSKTHVVQRFTAQPNGTVSVEQTFDDPNVFTEPFKRTFSMRKGQPFQEYICQENNMEGGFPTKNGQSNPTVFRGQGAKK
jgi:hypothetical protein